VFGKNWRNAMNHFSLDGRIRIEEEKPKKFSFYKLVGELKVSLYKELEKIGIAYKVVRFSPVILDSVSGTTHLAVYTKDTVYRFRCLCGKWWLYEKGGY